jgi:hypothetical protein
MSSIRPSRASFDRGYGLLEFDAEELYAAMDTKRIYLGLSWPQVAAEIWDQSSIVNARRHDHPISPSTIKNIPRRGNTSCQHALFFLRWLDRSPESFLGGGEGQRGTKLPAAGPDRRPRWDLRALYEALDAKRQEEEMTWPQLARVLRCTPSQLTGLRKAKFATGMGLAMRIVQWLGRPAADFVYSAEW